MSRQLKLSAPNVDCCFWNTHAKKCDICVLDHTCSGCAWYKPVKSDSERQLIKSRIESDIRNYGNGFKSTKNDFIFED